MGYNVAYKVVKIRTIGIQMCDEVEHILTNVRHVSKLKKSLIAPSTLADIVHH